MEGDDVIDWSDIFAEESGGFLETATESPVESPSPSPSPSGGCRMEEIEKELMKDEEDDGEKDLNEFCEQFLEDIFPESKKRRRQIRNREAAVRSRERKKEYVKELEMKSKYLESECRRLGRLLQWYCADNQSLRLMAAAKQESAVLFLESLLLGSLLWCLCLLPNTPPPPLLLHLSGGAAPPPPPPPPETSPVPSFLQTRTCKASWTKMKNIHPPLIL